MSLFDDLNRYVGLLREDRIQGKEVNYRGYRESREYREFLRLLRQMSSADPGVLGKGNAAKAFWINFYNAATIYSVVQYGAPATAAERKGFFHRDSFNVGGRDLSLNDVEHGILRGNRRAPYTLFRPFGRNDPRLVWRLEPDPRIHFALNCGSRSCPPIRHFDAERLEEQLETATREFIHQEVHLSPAADGLLVSMIFNWYGKDFGDVKAFIARYTDNPTVKALAERSESPLRYMEYDWTLNGSF